MIIHEKDISKSIELNIIGTSNIVRACQKNNVKLIFFSTNLVYPGNKNLSKETDSLLPFNNYGWSKLGAEAAVHMYKNSLILRLCITEKPFIHKHAYTNMLTNFMFHDEFANNFKKLLFKKGIINVGGKKTSVFNFANRNKAKVYKKKLNSKFLNQSMSVKKYNKIINNE
jgi:dTDP-4-dehydrorhamnose reductase